ncbi:hypothetical protein [Paenibacillus ehimensis]|uniref:Secreted protein n=1 Tax=Paenibacillus ehimensis TaxID=79264 RepID=A0ABT8VLF8_9BACL|nr:hypothetical protein [Paenibacillus ehimensis]MDO3681812.1 hypothetical protein [Paenibacillus ehimensis]
MKKAKSIALLSCLSLVLAVPNAALAAVDTHETSGVIFQYGPNGGVTFSVSAQTGSILTYTSTYVGANKYQYTYTKSDASIKSDSSHGLSSCNSSMAVRTSTNFNNSSVSLTENSSYWVSPGTTIVGKNSGSGWSTNLTTSFSANVDNEGYVQPAGNKCFGGGTVRDSFTISH